MSQSRARIKPGRASLIGGAAVAVASFVLWAAVARELDAANPTVMIAGALVAIGIGTWIRIADL